MVVDPNYFNWKLLFLKPYKTYQTHQTHPTVYISHHFTSFSHVEFDFVWHPEISRSTVYPSLQGREAIVVPGVDLGPRRQQHPADLRAAVARRPVQRGAAAEDAVLRGPGHSGHSAGVRPHDVPAPRRGGRARSPRWQGRGHNETQKIFKRRLELEFTVSNHNNLMQSV